MQIKILNLTSEVNVMDQILTTKGILSHLNNVISAANEAKKNWKEAEDLKKRALEGRPIPSDEVLKNVFEACESSDIFIGVCLLVYEPACFIGGKLRTELAKKIGKMIGVSHYAIYVRKKKIEVWLRVYGGFRKKIDSKILNLSNSEII